MQDDGSAAVVAGGLSLLKGLGSLIPQTEAAGDQEAFATMAVERSGPVVSVAMVVTDSVRR
jgi:hypothetical protein